MKAVGVFAVKGGVGKTTIAIDLALRLKNYGKVGLLDVDWDNSNFAQFTGFDGKVEVTKDNRIKIPTWMDVKVFSPSLMIGRDRGVSMPVDRYVQMVSDVMEFGDWGQIDYLIIDLPPGSSDVWRGILTIFSNVLLGDLVVSQPGMVDALRKGLHIHKYLDIPVLGVVENMAYVECQCGERIRIFGESTSKQLSEEQGVRFFGEIPIIVGSRGALSKGETLPTAVLDDVAKAIVEGTVKQTSFLERFKESVLTKIKEEVEKILASIIVKIQKEINLSDYAYKYGFTEERPFILTITDEEGRYVLTRIPLQIKDGKLLVLSKPNKVDFEIVASFRTLARCLLGVAKIGGKYVAFNPVDAWLAGDIKVYGTGFTPRALRVIELFNSNEVKEQIKMFEQVLLRWV